MSSLKDVYWMASPLAIDQRNCLNDKKIKGLRHLSRYIDPKNEIHVFRKIQHWTLEIGDKCYELSPNTKKKLRLIKKATDMIEPRWVEAIQWREIRESKKIEPEKRKIGQTRKTHDEIEAEGKRHPIESVCPSSKIVWWGNFAWWRIPQWNLYGTTSTTNGTAFSPRTARTLSTCFFSALRWRYRRLEMVCGSASLTQWVID